MTAPRAVDKNGQRMSAMSYQGSEISILINPSAVGDNSDEESCIESENLSDSFVGSTETGHSSSSRRVDPMITSGRSGRYRLLVNEGIQRSSGTSSTEDETLPPIPQRRHRTTNSTSSMRPPPVPPHRTAQTSKRPTARAVRPTELALAISTVAAATARTPTPEPVVPPPPVPAHTHQRKTTKGRIPKPPRTTPPPVPIHRTVRRPVRGDSVESSNSNSNSESDWQERAKNMDQSELLEYVSNLKESSA
ncbi:hypothetical protein HDE_00349 [Halotydeus destructor]|nr:hypothetical protein HDE_00349 [Halotydeus destructor]